MPRPAIAASSDPGRQPCLCGTHVRDVSPQAAKMFETIARTASSACGCTMAALYLGEGSAEVSAAVTGRVGVDELAGLAARLHPLQAGMVVQIEDASRDPRLAADTAVTGPAAVRFVACCPLVLADGSCAGALCVLDPRPRLLDDPHVEVLQSLASLAAQTVEMRMALVAGNAPDGAETQPGPVACQARRGLQSGAMAEHGHTPGAGGEVVDDHRVYALMQGMRPGGGELQGVEDALRASRQLLDRTGHIAAVGGWELDLRTWRLNWSDQTRRIHEVDETFVPTLDSAIQFYAPMSRPVIREAVETGLRTGRPWDLELSLVTQRGRQIWVRAVGEVEFAHGQAVRMLGAFQDVTERRNLQTAAARMTSTLRAVIESLPANVSVVDAHGAVLFVNSSFERWFGLRRDKVLGRPLAEVLGPLEYERSRPWIERVTTGETVTFEKEYADRRDCARWAITYVPLWNEHGQTEGFVQVAHGLFKHRPGEGSTVPASHRDALTGLLDRSGFVSYLERQMAEGLGDTLALLCIDVDLAGCCERRDGIGVGDRLLQLFAQRLAGLIRSRDAVARLGARQFAVALTGIADARHAQAIADKVIAAARQPFEIRSKQLEICARVGAAWGVGSGRSWTALLAEADAVAFRGQDPGCPAGGERRDQLGEKSGA